MMTYDTVTQPTVTVAELWALGLRFVYRTAGLKGQTSTVRNWFIGSSVLGCNPTSMVEATQRIPKISFGPTHFRNMFFHWSFNVIGVGQWSAAVWSHPCCNGCRRPGFLILFGVDVPAIQIKKHDQTTCCLLYVQPPTPLKDVSLLFFQMCWAARKLNGLLPLAGWLDGPWHHGAMISEEKCVHVHKPNVGTIQKIDQTCQLLKNGWADDPINGW